MRKFAGPRGYGTCWMKKKNKWFVNFEHRSVNADEYTQAVGVQRIVEEE